MLVEIDMLLGMDILRHVLVDVQVVGRQIGHHGHLGRVGHIHQLEGAQLHHSDVCGLHLIGQGQQRLADVAAHPDGLARVLENLGNERGGGGLPVGAGDREDLTGAHREKCLHLRGDDTPLLPQLHQRGIFRVHARRAEDHVGGEMVEIICAGVKHRAGLLQLQHRRIQLLPGRFIASGDMEAMGEQQADQRLVAHADAQHRNFLPFQGIKVGIQGFLHGCPSFLTRVFILLYSPGKIFAIHLTSASK